MLEFRATEPMTLDIYRALTPHDHVTFDENGVTVDAVESWCLDYGAALAACCDSTSPGDLAWLAHATANFDDLRDVNVIGDWATVDIAKVQIVELIPLRPPVKQSIIDLLTGQLEDVDQRLERGESELRALRDEAEELRKLEDNDADEE
jgi:hypothetical protein